MQTGEGISLKLYIVACIVCVGTGLLIGCETSPYERRQTQAVQPPVTGSYSTERELLQDNSMDLSFLRIDGPKDKNDTIHVRPLGAQDWDLFPGKPQPEAALRPIEVPHGTINLQPTGIPPAPAKP